MTVSLGKKCICIWNFAYNFVSFTDSVQIHVGLVKCSWYKITVALEILFSKVHQLLVCLIKDYIIYTFTSDSCFYGHEVVCNAIRQINFLIMIPFVLFTKCFEMRSWAVLPKVLLFSPWIIKQPESIYLSWIFYSQCFRRFSAVAGQDIGEFAFAIFLLLLFTYHFSLYNCSRTEDVCKWLR